MSNAPPLLDKERTDKQKIIGATKLDQEKWRKKNIGETEDRLDAIGSPSEKTGIKAITEAYKDYQQENFRIKTDRIEWLFQKAKYSKERWIDYYPHVHTLVRYELSFLELPTGYTIASEVTLQGIKFTLKDRFNQTHIGGFTPCGIALYDEQACRSSVNKIDDLISKLEAHPKNGIYL